MKYLIDTHVALWWATDDRKLDKAHARVLERAERSGEEVGLSAISLWEIAMQIERGRFEVVGTLEALLADVEANTVIVPLTSAIAIDSVRLGARMHGDPSDRIIVATARCHSLTLLTSDRKLIACGLVAVA